jgi:hypothetical protein
MHQNCYATHTFPNLSTLSIFNEIQGKHNMHFHVVIYFVDCLQ